MATATPPAADGITYASVDQVPVLQMAPGDRADVLVEAGAEGTYQLVSPMDVDLSDPADLNPDIPGYYISENFPLCQ